MSANIDNAGNVRQLDQRAEPDEQVLEEEVQEPPRLVRLLMRILRDVAQLKRRWAPRRIDFEDIAVDNGGSTKYRLPHGFNGRVRYYAVNWKNVVGATVNTGLGTIDIPAAPCLEEHADTDSNTLVLVSHSAGTVTIRVEAAG